MNRRRIQLRRWLVAVVLLGVVGTAAVVVIHRHSQPTKPAGCAVAVGRTSYFLDLAQAANAATISAVSVRRGLSDHAVSVALATALQESKLHNLPYGDRDSVGLFQQRPSQGWGPRAKLLDPYFAANAFFSHLVNVPGWRTLSVADAAQAVQRSADGSAYAVWEPEARSLARALTGEVGHGLACSYGRPHSSPPGLSVALNRDIGPGAIGVPVAIKAGWMTASWLVAQGAQYGIDTVTFDGQRWTRSSGHWRPTPGREDVVRFSTVLPGSG